MKKIGVSGVALSGLTGEVVASPSSEQNTEDIAFETEVLGESTASDRYERATSQPPVKGISEFVTDEEGYEIETDAITGFRITGDEVPEHVVVRLPLQSHSDEGLLELRIYDDSATAEAMVRDEVYWSSPEIIDSEAAKRARTTENQDVVSALEWDRQRRSNTVGTLGTSCMQDPTFDAAGPACTFLQGLTAIAGGALMLVPEPGSTAVGSVGIATVLAGECTIMQALDEAFDCDVGELGICITYPSITSLPKAYVYPVDCA